MLLSAITVHGATARKRPRLLSRWRRCVFAWKCATVLSRRFDMLRPVCRPSLLSGMCTLHTCSTLPARWLVSCATPVLPMVCLDLGRRTMRPLSDLCLSHRYPTPPLLQDPSTTLSYKLF